MKEFKYQDIEFVINNAQENYAIEVQKNRKMRVCEIKSVNRHSMISDGAVSS